MPLLPEPSSCRFPESAQLLYENRFLHLAIDAHQPWLYACWLGEIDHAMLCAGAETIVRTVREHGIAKLLNDNRPLTNLQIDLAAWRQIDYLSQLHAASLHYIAWVYSDCAQIRFLVDDSLGRNRWPLTLTFEEYDVALDWLRNVA
ncbi:hypothetical protein [Hymenobacter yonginensis]|uniref:STAS/SEC14 domain-containing protein n=1 Tax=Hymenobacter yonginensis TaxID=748197 RepID=A0ABY7PI45_9BACT|nr:hypothetical protein [Hymenobacter yonginensis]WBO83061.1 hypothetical protein O9Z63_11790 [Hymenobacter yonginensis]